MTPCDNNGRMPHEVLMEAIVEQAVKDYRKSAAKLRRAENRLKADPTDEKAVLMKRRALYMLRDVTTFFRSRWFSTLYELDGKEFIDRLRKECDL